MTVLGRTRYRQSSVVCLCLLVTVVCRAKPAEPMEIPIGVRNWWAKEPIGAQTPYGKCTLGDLYPTPKVRVKDGLLLPMWSGLSAMASVTLNTSP